MTQATPITLQLIGHDLLLRAWQEEDAAGLHAAMRESHESIGRWLSWCRADYSLDDAKAWIAHCREAWLAGGQFAFAVFDQQDQLVGSVDIKQHDLRVPCGNVGYWMRASRQGEGLCTRAVAVLAEFGFERLGLQRLEILVVMENRASRRVAEKLGATLEGVARRRLQVDGRARDAAVYALIAADDRVSGCA